MPTSHPRYTTELNRDFTLKSLHELLASSSSMPPQCAVAADRANIGMQPAGPQQAAQASPMPGLSLFDRGDRAGAVAVQGRAAVNN